MLASRSPRSASRLVEIALRSGTTSINLSSLGLKTVPAALQQLRPLRQLTLSRNSLTAFPEEILSLSNLEELYIDHNSITSFPENIALHLPRLRVLYAHSNQLSVLPAT